MKKLLIFITLMAFLSTGAHAQLIMNSSGISLEGGVIKSDYNLSLARYKKLTMKFNDEFADFNIQNYGGEACIWSEKGLFHFYDSDKHSLANVYANSFKVYSDERMKENIQPLLLGLSNLTKTALLKAETNLSVNSRANTAVECATDFFIDAESLKEIIPSAVKELDGQYYINYQEIIPVLIKSIQDLSSTVEANDSRIDVLQTKMSEVKKTLKSDFLSSVSYSSYPDWLEIDCSLSSQKPFAIVVSSIGGEFVKQYNVDISNPTIAIDVSTYPKGVLVISLMKESEIVDITRFAIY